MHPGGLSSACPPGRGLLGAGCRRLWDPVVHPAGTPGMIHPPPGSLSRADQPELRRFLQQGCPLGPAWLLRATRLALAALGSDGFADPREQQCRLQQGDPVDACGVYGQRHLLRKHLGSNVFPDQCELQCCLEQGHLADHLRLDVSQGWVEPGARSSHCRACQNSELELLLPVMKVRHGRAGTPGYPGDGLACQDREMRAPVMHPTPTLWSSQLVSE